ncbi:hypothetical protein KXQ82_11720 [Mucilaginibacter sp. HMF5004]|uniref:hypothetical protein n=1 Tax=Mucilaginibacter rivuli TaxID=2857527 RepID=UPI001C5D3100|nr:hypothetical protein [Mucilaginibacter rivuli]MBW4890393.1 hypothetical protein [Mucilaginibacter rivuli]
MKPFLLLLIIVCATEIIGANVQWFNVKKNYLIYNVYLLLSMPVYFWIFMNMLDFKGYIKTIYLIVVTLVMCFLAINFLFLQGPKEFNVYSLIMVEFIKGILALMIITKLFREDNYEIGISKNPYFWIGGATLIFSVCAIVLFGLQRFIVLNKIQIEGKSIYRVIVPLINVILYSSYCYAFYLCKKLTSNL